MKRLSDLVNDASLPYIRMYVKRGRMGAAEKLSSFKIR